MPAWSRILGPARCFSRVSHGHEAATVHLASTSVGEGRHRPLLLLHGLFGSKRNWRGFSKALQRSLKRPVYAVDLRNHGASPHAVPHTYEAMAADVGTFIRHNELENVSLIGHSMGAKVAMTLALSLAKDGDRTQTISDLVVVDMPPAKVKIGRQMRDYVTAMENLNSMPPGMIKTLSDADRFLAPFEPDASNREFLLTNLLLGSHSRAVSPQQKTKFILPLDILSPAIDNMELFPFDHGAPDHPVWTGPTLVLAGRGSEYEVAKYSDTFTAFFPNHRLEVLDTGHWVQAERPTEFLKLVVDFLKR